MAGVDLLLETQRGLTVRGGAGAALHLRPSPRQSARVCRKPVGSWLCTDGNSAVLVSPAKTWSSPLMPRVLPFHVQMQSYLLLRLQRDTQATRFSTCTSSAWSELPLLLSGWHSGLTVLALPPSPPSPPLSQHSTLSDAGRS